MDMTENRRAANGRILLWDFALRNLHVDRDGDYVRISLTREQCDAAGRSMFAWRHRFSPG